MKVLIPVITSLGFIHLVQLRQRWKSFNLLKGAEINHNQMLIVKKKKPMKEHIWSVSTKLLKILSEIEV